MDNVYINMWGDEQVYASQSMLYLEDATGNFSNIETYVSGSTMHPPNGFVIIRSYVSFYNVSLSNLVAVQPDSTALPYHGNGGAFYFESSNVTMRRCVVRVCQAVNGSGMYVRNSSVEIIDTDFVDNIGYYSVIYPKPYQGTRKVSE
jgi:hypothetical protein